MKVFDIVPGCTENCFARSGRKLESTTAACLVNFGFPETGEALKKKIAEVYADELGTLVGDLPGMIVKNFICNFDTGVFGGFYLWESAEGMINWNEGKTPIKTPDGDLFLTDWLASETCNPSIVTFSACKI